MKSLGLSIVLALALVAVPLTAAPTTKPAGTGSTTQPVTDAKELVGDWKLDRAATIDKAVAAEPAAKQDEVRKLLNSRLPEQTFMYKPDGQYTTISQVSGEMEQTDNGTYTVADGQVKLVSTKGAMARSLPILLDGKTMIINDILIFQRTK